MSGRQSRLQRRAGAAFAGVTASASNVTQRRAVRKYLMRLNLPRSYCPNDTTRFVMDSTGGLREGGDRVRKIGAPKAGGGLVPPNRWIISPTTGRPVGRRRKACTPAVV